MTTLGASGTYPSAGGACNSYLVEEKDVAVLLDIGPGSLSNLFASPAHRFVEALVLTHMHPDHITDIFPYRYYLQFTADKARLPIKVFAPPGARERILAFSADSNTAAFDEVFDFIDLVDGACYRVGEMSIEFLEVAHMHPTFSVRVMGREGVVYYSSDTGWDERLARYAAGVDLFICEATLRREDAHAGVAHLSGVQAGEVATAAGVGRLVLSHLWAHFDKQQILTDAQESFAGPVELAAEGAVYLVGRA